MIRFCIMLFLLLSAGVCNSQNYTNLIFEGGGVRGVAYAGAIEELERQGVMKNIERVGGTSAGSIAALLIALGYTAHEIREITYHAQLESFSDGQYFFVGGIARTRKNFGWYKGEEFVNWVEELIHEKTGNGAITFGQLHERNYLDLYVTGTSLNNQKLIIFSHKTHPNMKVSDAIRISISIPLYFEAVIVDKEGHVISEEESKLVPYDIMVDGGFTANFPIFMFDDYHKVNGQMVRKPNPNTLGIRIDTNEQIEYDRQQKGLAPVPVESFNDYVTAFYTYVIENLNRPLLENADWERTISISSGKVTPKSRKLSDKQKDQLIENGRTAVTGFLNH